MSMFWGAIDRSDCYLRIQTEQTQYTREYVPNYPSNEGLLFVDIDGPTDIEGVAGAIQYAAIPSAGYVLFRWPADNSENKSLWLQQVVEKRILELSGATHVGIIDFRLGNHPSITWHREPSISNSEILIRSLRAEFRALLEWGHAIWRPTSYHYELPSGDHTDSFIRVADMFRNVRDVEVTATWFYDKLFDQIAVVTESASLIPLVIEIRRVMTMNNLTIAGTITLDEYPRTKFELRQSIENLGVRSGTLAIMSVNASGRYRDMILDTLEASQYEADLVTMVDKSAKAAECSVEPSSLGKSNVRSYRWLGLTDRRRVAPIETGCRHCDESATAQVVKIDPRSFQAMALPGQNLVMPDKNAAMDMAKFFTVCDSLDAIEYNSRSAAPNRQKGGATMPIKFDLGKLVGDAQFRKLALERLRSQRDQVEKAIQDSANFERSIALTEHEKCLVENYDCIIASSRDFSQDGFPELLQDVAGLFNISVNPIIVDVQLNDTSLVDQTKVPGRPLLVSLGSVSGWTLRQMIVAVVDNWIAQDVPGGKISAIVIHSTSRTAREFQNTAQSFSGRLHAVWNMYLPNRWPLKDEVEYLSDYSESAVLTSSPPLASLISRRVDVSTNKIGTRSIFLGPSEIRVRDESLYGRNLASLATLAAVGAAIQSARQRAINTDPRWPSFDFVSISRSYYDGLLVAAMLRWCKPGEVYWGGTPDEERKHIDEMMSRTTADADERVLYPELLLAALQGKIPRKCVSAIAVEAMSRSHGWPDQEKSDLSALVGLLKDASFDIGAALS